MTAVDLILAEEDRRIRDRITDLECRVAVLTEALLSLSSEADPLLVSHFVLKCGRERERAEAAEEERNSLRLIVSALRARVDAMLPLVELCKTIRVDNAESHVAGIVRALRGIEGAGK